MAMATADRSSQWLLVTGMELLVGTVATMGKDSNHDNRQVEAPS